VNSLWRKGLLTMVREPYGKGFVSRYSIPGEIREQDYKSGTIKIRVQGEALAVYESAYRLWDTGKRIKFQRDKGRREDGYKGSYAMEVVPENFIRDDTGLPNEMVRENIRWLSLRGFLVSVLETPGIGRYYLYPWQDTLFKDKDPERNQRQQYFIDKIKRNTKYRFMREQAARWLIENDIEYYKEKLLSETQVICDGLYKMAKPYPPELLTGLRFFEGDERLLERFNKALCYSKHTWELSDYTDFLESVRKDVEAEIFEIAVKEAEKPFGGRSSANWEYHFVYEVIEACDKVKERFEHGMKGNCISPDLLIEWIARGEIGKHDRLGARFTKLREAKAKQLLQKEEAEAYPFEKEIGMVDLPD